MRSEHTIEFDALQLSITTLKELKENKKEGAAASLASSTLDKIYSLLDTIDDAEYDCE